MKKEEVETLVLKKKKEGKTSKQCRKEIKEIKIFQEELKGQTKEIIRLNRLINKLEVENKKLKDELFKSNFGNLK